MKLTLRTTVVGLDMDADDWGLFAFGEHLEGAEAAAKRLNAKFIELVNAGQDRDEVRRGMSALMNEPENVNVGAGDSEPYYELERLLNKVFGKEDD